MIITGWKFIKKKESNNKKDKMEFTPEIILRCPKCGGRGHIRTMARLGGKRKCYHCGYIGEPKEFEVKPDKPKK